MLHVLKEITGGGVESWLAQVLENMDRRRFQMDIAVRSQERHPYDARFEELGSRVHHFTRPPSRLTFARPFREILERSGPYDIVHCHSLFNRGFVLRLARWYGVPVRIAHSHNAPTTDSTALRRFRIGLRARMQSLIWTGGIACSLPAGYELFGARWQQNPRMCLLYCGIDLRPFHSRPDPAIRGELGLPEGAFVFGHVGRLNHQKNHPLLVEILAEAVKRDPNAMLLMVGTGDLEPEIRAMVSRRGLDRNCMFAGQRQDVPRIMLGAMDAFVLPSLHEGLPLVGMEAQAAGLPMLVSDAITREMDVVDELIYRFPLSRPAADWADELLRIRDRGRGIPREEALARMVSSPFNIANSVNALQVFYEKCVAGSR